MMGLCAAAQAGNLASRLPGEPLPSHRLGNVGTDGAPVAVAWPTWSPLSCYNRESAKTMAEGGRRRHG